MIYALNTKNDEHEEEIESLKEAHEDEVRTSHSATHLHLTAAAAGKFGEVIAEAAPYKNLNSHSHRLSVSLSLTTVQFPQRREK